ncbi:trypsin-like serine protease [Candidatus Synechococcus calcipolaris G9]|uniref:Trypsin-like serine protease n=1 Tax=Candidatus Synechococcus calcipolaris G9 TaxID=1497997 RepID=A0ABT6EYT5_9SYNE|nr:trypsin-like serine protease [Candidatus Synechococcus calcipolaris]MDG2990637.1 trypsin-like serine protease [Candidatus Synechococcus calcipolaris G9]
MKWVKLFFVAAIALGCILFGQHPGHTIVSAFAHSPTTQPLPLDQYTGVVLLEPVHCSGTLLKGKQFVLTAAHCLNKGDPIPDKEITVVFRREPRNLKARVARYFIHPSWKGKLAVEGYDLALLELDAVVPDFIEAYDIYRDQDEIGKVFTKVGYGYIGLGSTGEDRTSNSDLNRHWGQNRYEALLDIFIPVTDGDLSTVVPRSQLMYDFDDGTPTRDAFGRYFPRLADLGLGKNEAGSGAGDSGGPCFIDGKVAAVTSWGFSDRGFFMITDSVDIDDEISNGSFGEFFSDTRVSFYAPWIDMVMNHRRNIDPRDAKSAPTLTLD